MRSAAAFFTFMQQRFSMFEARQRGQKPNLTCPILNDLHFTNIHRYVARLIHTKLAIFWTTIIWNYFCNNQEVWQLAGIITAGKLILGPGTWGKGWLRGMTRRSPFHTWSQWNSPLCGAAAFQAVILCQLCCHPVVQLRLLMCLFSGDMSCHSSSFSLKMSSSWLAIKKK